MLEKREADGSITLNRLREAAGALGCSLIYAVIPNKDLDSILKSEAEQVADKMMRGASVTMILEGQGTSTVVAEENREGLVRALIDNPKLIWNAHR